MGEQQMCPRRMETGQRGEGTDEWQVDVERTGHGYRTCTYCGGLHPADFITLIREGVEVEATDKSYKFYVPIPSTDPDRLWVVSTAYNHVPDGYLTWEQMSKEQRRAAKAGDYKKTAGFRFGTKPTQFGKFYTQHFQQGYGATFRALRAQDAIRWKYPPYVPLYVPNTTDDGQPIVGQG